MDRLIRNGGKIGRFLVSGVVGLSVNLSVLHFLTDTLHIWYIYSAAVAFIASVCVSFILQKFWTFGDRSGDKIRRQALLFSLIITLNLCINVSLVYVFTDLLSIHYLFSQMIASGIIAIESYCLYDRLFVRSLVIVKRGE